MNEKELKEKIYDSGVLLYGELEYCLDEYLPNFFSVEVSDVGFNEEHLMNNLEFWFTVSWLVKMKFLNYGTSPRGAWLTEEGQKFKDFILKGGKITNVLHKDN